MQSGETKRQGGNGDVREKGKWGSQQNRQDLPLWPYVLLDWKLQSCGLHPAHLMHSMEKTDRMTALPSVCASAASSHTQFYWFASCFRKNDNWMRSTGCVLPVWR